MALQLILAGLVVGILLGMTGMGGGSLMTPILILLGIPPTQAIGSDLLFSAITKSLGAAGHARRKNVEWKLVARLALGSVPFSFLGALSVTYFSHHFPHSNQIIIIFIGALILVVGMILLMPRQTTASLSMDQPLKTFLIGAVVGFLVGLTSVGSGTLFAVILIVIFKLAPRRVVGTDIMHGTLLVISASLAHLIEGNILFGTVGWLLIGSLPGILLGVKFSGLIPEKNLQRLLASLLILSGAVLLYPS